MKFVSFEKGGAIRSGLLVDDRVMDLADAAGACGETVDLSSVLTIVRGGADSLAAAKRLLGRAAEVSAAWHGAKELKFVAPIPLPLRNVFCVGRNYVDHVKEGYEARQQEIKLPVAPQFFTKATHAIIGPGGDVRLDPRVTSKLDYEVELAIIIGRTGRDIPAENAFDYIFGYCIANDVTARDLQRRHEQWFKGKSLDTTLPLGPYIATRDEITDVESLELTLTVNGEARQQARVGQMIFNIPALLASLSAGLTLEAGDIIATGTPSGVGFAMNPPQYLKNGDVVVARITNLGELRNRIVEV